VTPTASDQMAERLIEWGVDTVFGLPGDGINGFYEAFCSHQDRFASSTCATRRSPQWPIGAFSAATLGSFDMERTEYKEIPVEEQVEVLSPLGGNVPKEDGEPQVHVHVVIGRSVTTTKRGHLLEAHVRLTLEVIFTESPEHLSGAGPTKRRGSR
jgi:predicted DNA-binding protein with PD1-like motif